MQVRDANKGKPGYNFKRALDLIEGETDNAPLLSVPEQTHGPSLIEFPESWLDSFELAYTETEVHPYLAEREVNCTTARRLDLRWDGSLNRVCFPIRDFHGRLCGLHGRSVEPTSDLPYFAYGWKGHRNAHVWSNEHLVDFDKPVVVVESVFDMVRVYPVFPNVICPRFATFGHDMLKRLNGLSRAITLFDNDAAGDFARNTMSSLSGCVITHLSCAPYKDAGKMPEPILVELLAPYSTTSLFSLA